MRPVESGVDKQDLVLDTLFGRTAERQYTRELLFSSGGGLMTPGSLISKEVPQILAPAECKYLPES